MDSVLEGVQEEVWEEKYYSQERNSKEGIQVRHGKANLTGCLGGLVASPSALEANQCFSHSFAPTFYIL